MKKWTLISLSIIGFLILISCENNDDHPIRKMVMVKKTKYHDGEFVYEWNFEYDSGHKLVRSNFDFGNYDLYFYDEKGRQDSIESYNDGSLNNIFTYEYNDLDQIVRNNSLSSDRILEYYHMNEYNSKGLIVKRTLYFANGNPSSLSCFDYDSRKNVSKRRKYSYNRSGEIDSASFEEAVYTYDNKINVYRFTDYSITGKPYVNNILNILTTHYPDSNVVADIDYSYIYNEDDYPSEYWFETDRYVYEYQDY